LGAVVSADLPIPQGQTMLYVEVGGSGGGFNGGGTRNGGDASDVRLVPRAQPGSLSSRAVVAGGGGGSGYFPGGDAGADGAGGAAGGKAGTASNGGAGGGPCSSPCASGGAGSLGQGGTGVGGGGGGGGGYYGGGGGSSANCGANYCDESGGGGGGSSYASPQALNVTFGLDSTRTPQVTITASTPPRSSPPPDSTPSLTALRVTPSSFAITGRQVAGRCQALSPNNNKHRRCKRPIALRIGYQLNVTASVTFAIKQVLTGRLVNGKCTSPTRRNRHARACTRFVPVPGTLTPAGVAGAHHFSFNGRIGGRLLGPGTYQLAATPSSSNSVGTPDIASFRLLP
jgi:hypothetical protein